MDSIVTRLKNIYSEYGVRGFWLKIITKISKKPLVVRVKPSNNK